jgi:malate dehydrogenase (oxaloacetate-decarboxylating)
MLSASFAGRAGGLGRPRPPGLGAWRGRARDRPVPLSAMCPSGGRPGGTIVTRVVRVAVVGDDVEGEVAAPGSRVWARLSEAAQLVDRVPGVDARPVLVQRRGVAATVHELGDLASRFNALVLTGFDARCLAIERGLADAVPGPVVVHERHGLAVVALVCLRDAVSLRGEPPARGRVVVRGAGAAAIGVVGLLRRGGVEDLVVLTQGRILTAGDVDSDVPDHMWLATHTNPGRIRGGLAEAAADAVAVIDLEGGAWDVATTAGVMARSPALMFLAPEDPTRRMEAAPPGAILGRCRPHGPDSIAGLDVLAGLAKGLATTGRAAIGNDVLEAAATGLESSLARSGVPPLGWASFDADVAVAVADVVAASTGPGQSAAGLAP